MHYMMLEFETEGNRNVAEATINIWQKSSLLTDLRVNIDVRRSETSTKSLLVRSDDENVLNTLPEHLKRLNIGLKNAWMVDTSSQEFFGRLASVI